MAGVRDGDTDETFSHLGLCPNCETEIPSSKLLVTYESADDWPRMFAECPECVAVVSPM